MKLFTLFSFVFLCLGNYFLSADANALLQPPSRGLIYTRSSHASPSYNYMDLNCGGIGALRRNEGKCGLCGDAFDGKRNHEIGGKYYTGKINQVYQKGERLIGVKVLLNHNGDGRFEFRLCNPIDGAETEECFNQHLLEIHDVTGEFLRRYAFYPDTTGLIDIYLHIPAGLNCTRCVLQWKYITGNTWGRDNSGNMCNGCGPQETYVNCADIAIEGWEHPFRNLPAAVIATATDIPLLPITVTMTTTTTLAQTTTTTPLNTPKPISAVRWVRPQDKDEAPRMRQMILIPGLMSAVPDPPAAASLSIVPIRPIIPVQLPEVKPEPEIIPLPPDPEQASLTSKPNILPKKEIDESLLRVPYRASGPNLIPRPPKLFPTPTTIHGSNDHTIPWTAQTITPLPQLPNPPVPHPHSTSRLRKAPTANPMEHLRRNDPSFNPIGFLRAAPTANPISPTKRKPPTVKPSAHESRNVFGVRGSQRQLFDIRPYTRSPISRPPPVPSTPPIAPGHSSQTRKGVFAEYGISSQTIAPTVASWPKERSHDSSLTALSQVEHWKSRTPPPNIDLKTRPPVREFNARYALNSGASSQTNGYPFASTNNGVHVSDNRYDRYALSSLSQSSPARNTLISEATNEQSGRYQGLWDRNNGQSNGNNLGTNHNAMAEVLEPFASDVTPPSHPPLDPQYRRYNLEPTSFRSRPVSPHDTAQNKQSEHVNLNNGYQKSYIQQPTEISKGREMTENRHNVRHYDDIISRRTSNHAQPNVKSDPVSHELEKPLSQSDLESRNTQIYKTLYKSDRVLSSRYPGLGKFEPEIKPASATAGQKAEALVVPNQTSDYHRGQKGKTNAPESFLDVEAYANEGVPVKLSIVAPTTTTPTTIKPPTTTPTTTTTTPTTTTTTATTTTAIIATTDRIYNLVEMRANLMKLIAEEKAKGGLMAKPSKAVLQAMRDYMAAKSAAVQPGNALESNSSKKVKTGKDLVEKTMPKSPVNSNQKDTVNNANETTQSDRGLTAAQTLIAEQEKQIRLLKEQQKALQDRLFQAKMAQQERMHQEKEQQMLEQKRRQEEEAKQMEIIRRKELRAFIRKQIEQKRHMERQRLLQEQKLQAEQAKALILKQQEEEKRRKQQLEAQILAEAKEKAQKEHQRLLEIKRQQELETQRLAAIQRKNELRLQQHMAEQKLRETKQRQELERLKTDRLRQELEQERLKIESMRRQIEEEQKQIHKINLGLTTVVPALNEAKSVDQVHIKIPFQNDSFVQSDHLLTSENTVPLSTTDHQFDNTAMSPVDHLPFEASQNSSAAFDKSFNAGYQSVHDVTADRFSQRLSSKMSELNTTHDHPQFSNIEIMPLSKTDIMQILSSIASKNINGHSEQFPTLQHLQLNDSINLFDSQHQPNGNTNFRNSQSQTAPKMLEIHTGSGVRRQRIGSNPTKYFPRTDNQLNSIAGQDNTLVSNLENVLSPQGIESIPQGGNVQALFALPEPHTSNTLTILDHPLSEGHREHADVQAGNFAHQSLSTQPEKGQALASSHIEDKVRADTVQKQFFSDFNFKPNSNSHRSTNFQGSFQESQMSKFNPEPISERHLISSTPSTNVDHGKRLLVLPVNRLAILNFLRNIYHGDHTHRAAS